MKNVLVTGAHGFIGGHVVKALVQNGYTVHGHSRSVDAATSIRAAGATPLVGEAIQRIEQGAFAVVHCAARVHQMRETAVDPLAEFRSVNRDLTLGLARKAADAGAKVFVFLSSVKVMGDRATGEGPVPIPPYR